MKRTRFVVFAYSYHDNVRIFAQNWANKKMRIYRILLKKNERSSFY